MVSATECRKVNRASSSVETGLERVEYDTGIV